jgi:hypothetical protein
MALDPAVPQTGGQKPFVWNLIAKINLFREGQGTLQLSVFDILNPTKTIVRRATDAYKEELDSEAFRRNVMISFRYIWR